MTGNPFNKYCIDCKKNKTTHFLVWLGSFVCEPCSVEHLNMPNGCMSKTYAKKVYNEQWDDLNLKSLALGGNKHLFEILKEYDLQDLPINKKYSSPAAKWYIKKHAFALDDFEYKAPKPAKTMNERVNNIGPEIENQLDIMDSALDTLADKSARMSMAVDRAGKAAIAKIKSKPFVKNLMRRFSKKENHERRASMSEEPEDDIIEQAKRSIEEEEGEKDHSEPLMKE